MSENVACHSETSYSERPVSFEWQGCTLEVIEVIQRWRTPRGMRFQVRANDDQVYELFYDLIEDYWKVIQL